MTGCASAVIVRFGSTLFVVGFADRHTATTVTRAEAEAQAVARFEFTGRAARTNPAFTAALAAASQACRDAVGP
jgi:hypothetical protein